MEREENSKNKQPNIKVVKEKQKWQKPQLMNLNTIHTKHLAPDIADGGGPYS